MKQELIVSPPLTPATPPVGNASLAMILFIASETMLFVGLISGYVVLRAGSGGFSGMPDLPVGWTAFSTAVIAASSGVLLLAARAGRQGDRSSFERWSAATLALALFFVALQGLEWSNLVSRGLFPRSNVHSGLFYALSGIHGVHVLGGIVLLVLLTLKARRTGATSANRIFLTVTSIYWHFVTAVWLTLFTMLYIL